MTEILLKVALNTKNRPPRYNWNIVESGIKHHNHNLISVLKQIMCLLSIVGFLVGAKSYYTHRRCHAGMCGLDWRENEKPATTKHHYSTHLFSGRTEDIINSHNSSNVYILIFSVVFREKNEKKNITMHKWLMLPLGNICFQSRRSDMAIWRTAVCAK